MESKQIPAGEPCMSRPVAAENVSLLTLEFLEWISSRPRTYADVMEAWRTTCPRHPVWEDALLNGLVQIQNEGVMDQSLVRLTPAGRILLNGQSES